MTQTLRKFEIRPARHSDIEALQALIVQSARGLSGEDYSDAELEAAITYVFGVDSELVADGSYFTILSGAEYVACGGWSRRQTLFGGDQFKGRAEGFLDPQTDAAKIRAFFVHPDYARQGLGRMLLEHCEAAAQAHGFKRMEMMATLPGINLYRACGYAGDEVIAFAVPDGRTVRFVPMSKAF